MVRTKQIFPTEKTDDFATSGNDKTGSKLPKKSGKDLDQTGSKLPGKSGKRHAENFDHFDNIQEKPTTSKSRLQLITDINSKSFEQNCLNKKMRLESVIDLDVIDLNNVNINEFFDEEQTINWKVGYLFKKAGEGSDIQFFALGDLNIECKFCNALHFAEEKPLHSKGGINEFFSCCNFGKYTNLLSNLNTYPDELKILYAEESELHKLFIENIRKYNNSFACASLACNRFSFSTPGPSCFKISGQIYHKFNSVAQPIDLNSLPTNGQLYFLDNNEAQNIRLISNDLNKCLIEKIETSLRKNYPFAKAYEMMKNVINEQHTPSEAIVSNDNKEVKMLLSYRSGFDPNRYNIQQVNEVAAIIVCNANDEVPPANIIVIEKGSKELKNIFPLDPIVEPLTYPLLYPLGNKGWDVNLKDKIGKRISFCDFTKFKLFYRPKFFLPHHYSGKLFQQWTVDQAARVEWNRLNFIRTHQKELRACNYKGLTDYLMNKAEQTGSNIGRQVILPSSFLGGPRNKDQNFVDSMAMVGENGKPDLFITYTINPEDIDIKKCLFKGQKPEDRPDIVSRIFKLKSDKLIEEVVNGEIFGKVIAYCWVVEFQKRGLPHLHFLVTLHPKDKLKNTKEIDNFIRAELPNKEKEPFLRSLVKKFMMHGPCSNSNINAPCMRKGKCRFKFPKKFREEIQLGEDGYALYKRSNNGDFEFIKGERLTNQNVVPYNPYLLMRFKSHINVEVCSEINAIKYIYKYIYKGYDAATVECIKEDANGEKTFLKYDEIGQYLEARYLSPVEACYRLFKYELQGKSHTVERLEVHLENEQTVYFDPNSNDDNLEEAMQKGSKLIAYFNFFKEYPNALFHLARSFSKKVMNMAFSGIAATLLKNGRTVHSCFKLPLDLNSNSLSSIEINSKEANEIRQIDVFIFDEAPMAPKYVIEIMDKKLKEIHNNDSIFGGKIMILSGDFRQCLPIKNKATKAEILDLTIQKSELWNNFKIFHLTQNMRSDPECIDFAEQILKIGSGNNDDTILRLPEICNIGSKDLINEVFSEIINKRDFSKLCSYCILTPYNREVNFYNEKVLSEFPGENYIFKSIDEAESKGAPILPEILNKFESNSLPDHELKLKINCITKLIRNLNVSAGLCNGTRLQILDIGKNVLRVMILTGDRKGETEFIPRISIIEDKKFPFILKRHQFPLKLAFCMTINGAQGQTFEKIGIDLSREVFSHGQLYVALSRTRNWERIKIKYSNENTEKLVKNIVWLEAL